MNGDEKKNTKRMNGQIVDYQRHLRIVMLTTTRMHQVSIEAKARAYWRKARWLKYIRLICEYTIFNQSAFLYIYVQLYGPQYNEMRRKCICWCEECDDDTNLRQNDQYDEARRNDVSMWYVHGMCEQVITYKHIECQTKTQPVSR